jgi:hypothetical protein
VALFKGSMRFSLVAVFLFVLVGCQTAQERRVTLLKDRVDKLRPLAHWAPVQCRIEAHLTAPTRARYRAMFPNEKDILAAEALVYTWHARETASHVVPSESTPLTQNYRSFLEATLDLLLQVHFVRSPFDELTVHPNDVVAADDKVFIRTSGEYGIYLDPKEFVIETRTRSHGVLTAHYALGEGGEYLPSSLSQDLKATRVVLDRFEWDNVPVAGRRMIKAVWLSVGESDKTIDHSLIYFLDCNRD